jgi:hypothetical protein
LAGGLGNQLFEIAAAASLAKDNEAQLLINPTEHILPNQGRNINNYTGNIFHKVAIDCNPPLQHVYKWDKSTYAPIPYKPNLKIESHCQSWKYFDHNRDYIQSLFAPKFTPEKIWDKCTGVQIRRGDYYKFPDHHPQLPVKYFIDAIKLAAPEEITIFTDDIKWCKDNLPLEDFDAPVMFPEDEDWIELVNTTNTSIDLAGFYLSDDPLNLMSWAFPAGTTILANSILLIS